MIPASLLGNIEMTKKQPAHNSGTQKCFNSHLMLNQGRNQRLTHKAGRVLGLSYSKFLGDTLKIHLYLSHTDPVCSNLLTVWHSTGL